MSFEGFAQSHRPIVDTRFTRTKLGLSKGVCQDVTARDRGMYIHGTLHRAAELEYNRQSAGVIILAFMLRCGASACCTDV
jgi:hypothetical protein